MNKIYRTLWNKATQSSVVVSELAKSGGKKSSAKTSLVNAAGNITLTASLLLVSASASSIANTTTGNTHQLPDSKGNYCIFDKITESVICGDEKTTTINKTTDNKPPKSVIIGKGAINEGESNVVIGPNAKAGAAAAAIAIGHDAQAKQDQAIAIGQHAEGNGKWDIAIGRFAGQSATPPTGNEGRNIAIGDGALRHSNNVNNNTVLGTSAGQYLVGSHNIIMGSYANAHNAIQSAISAGTPLDKTKTKSKQVDGKTVYYVETPNTVAIGHRALATESGSVAVGQQAKGFGVTTVAIGNASRALDNHAIAVGRDTNAGASGAIAIGLRANYQAEDKTKNITAGYKTTGASSIAMGVDTNASATHSVAIGTNATVEALKVNASTIITDKKGNQIVANDLGTALTGIGSVSIGPSSIVKGTNAVAIGQAAETLGQNAFAGGNDSHANGKSAVAIGDGATSLKDASTAIGAYTKAFESGAAAFGFNAQALTFRSLALGAEALAKTGNYAIAIGNKAKSESQDAITMGHQAHTRNRAENGIAIGKSALSGGRDSFSLGTNAGSFGVDIDNLGENNAPAILARTLTGKTNAQGLVNLTSIGNQAGKDTINNNYGINIGYQAGSGGYNSVYGEGISIGNKAGMLDKTNLIVKKAMEDFSSTKLNATTGTIVTGNTNTAISSRAGINALGHDNVAIGKDAGGYSSGNSNIAIGRHAGRIATANNPHAIDLSIFNSVSNTTAIGEWAYASAQNTTAIGTKAKASQIGAMAFGHEAMANHKDAVALGANSVTADVIKTNEATVQGFTYSGFAGNEPLSSVSIGSDTIKRTLTNVAAGRISSTSTDAINGSQLYLALNTLGYVGDTLVTNVLGGNANIVKNGNTAGSLTMSNIGGTGESNHLK